MFDIDLKSGTVNGLRPSDPIRLFKEKLPCYSTNKQETASFRKCGSGLYYPSQDLFFNSSKNYIEVRSNYDGRLSQYIFNQSVSSYRNIFGSAFHKTTKSGESFYYYHTDYGCLILCEEQGSIQRFFIWAKPWDEIRICEDDL